MPKWLTQEWLDTYRELAQSQPERPGVSVRLQYRVTGGPDGDVNYYWVVKDGKLVECKLGELEDAEVTITEKWDDAMAIQKLKLNPTVAFMQGKIKPSGSIGKLMSLLPITSSAEFRKLQEEVLALTEF